MTSEKVQTSLLIKLTKYLPFIEKICWTALGVGLLLTMLQIDKTVALVSLLGLGCTFFLLAYRPADIPQHEGERFGFSELLGLMIVPKVLWIGSSVSVVGISFYLLELNKEGYTRMLMIGGLTGIIATLILAILFVMSVKHLKTVLPILLRALPLSLVDLYLLLK
jgi:hypothetical protein